MSADRYEGDHITIVNHGERCIHSRACVMGRPDVFIPNADGPWINPDAAPADTVLAVVSMCPSGALQVEHKDGRPMETPPLVNHLRIQENGPLAVRAELDIVGQEGVGYRATLCRCGHSQNKPFCDGAHLTAGFTATGEMPPKDSPALATRGGPLTVRPAPNGPLVVSGPLEICGASGHTIDRVESAALCRCGASANKPYCDGSHVRIGFTAP